MLLIEQITGSFFMLFSNKKQQFALLLAANVLLCACNGKSGNTASAPTTSPALSSVPGSGGIGTLAVAPVATGNVVPILVDAGPVAGTSEVNVPYVSVTICTPATAATTAACQTIDHVLLDTGSYGLRLLSSAIYSNMSLPAVTKTNGQAIGECSAFAIGTTWGGVYLANIYLAGELAKSVPIQVIGTGPGGASTIPTDCSSTGAIQNTQALLGANGILGVGPFINDCDACLSQVIAATYYACTATGCTNSTVTSAQVVKNPVALFQNPTTSVAQDNNGTLIVMPAVSASGVTGSLSGSLIFGIGTQSNNALNSAVIYATDASGNFLTTYNGVSMPNSFIDSGSNALFFHAPTIPTCPVNKWTYCPASAPATYSATNAASSGIPSGLVSFTIGNADQLFTAGAIAANIGGTSVTGQNSFDWGFPFFFGRRVFTAISGASTPGGAGPYFAY